MLGVTSFWAVANLPWFACYAVLGASTAATTIATKPQTVRRNSRLWDASSKAAFHVTPPVFVDGKVDVFLDLACPDSAAAWTTIKQVVWDYGFRTEFVFHILPMSKNQAVFDAAKAVEVFRMHSADSDECTLLIDAMLDHRNLILNQADDDVARLQFFEEVLVKGAVVQGRFAEDQFRRWMEDPQVMHRVRNELESAASLGVYATPTAVLNGIHMMRLVGADQLRNFELFIDRGMAPQPLYQVGGASVWASVEGGATGGEGTNHGINGIRFAGLDGSGQRPKNKAMPAIK